MIQYKKILMTLALLLTAVTGAWAEETPLVTITIDSNGNPVYSAEGLVTLTGTNYNFDEIYGKYFWFPTTPSVTMSATVAAAADNVSITKVVFWSSDTGNNGDYNNSLEDTAAPYVCYANASVSKGGKSLSDDFATKVDDINISKIEVYGTAETIEVIPVAEPAANTKQWTFTQPGSDVVLTPLYAPTAKWATMGTEPEAKTLLPAAAEGVIAGTDDPLIKEGTGIVAFAGTSTEDRQGQVMYAVTAATATTAPALTSSDWKTTVPKASDIPNADDGAEVKVWYYIQGADAPQGEAATLDNTFNNTDPASLTVTVLSNKFDLTLKAANVNTIEAGMATVTVDDQPATVTDGKIEDVKMGSEVTMTTATGYKFRKVSCQFHNVSSQAYGICVYNAGDSWPLGFITFNIDDPSNVSVLNGTAGDYYGLDYCPADGYYYACNDDNKKLFKMDLNGNIVGTVATLDTYLTDGAWNPINNTMYAVYGKTLCTVNLSTGDLTTLVTSENIFYGIACNADGQLYATMGDGNLYTVNATTGVLTLVGATGYIPNSAQSLQFDKLTGNLYWCYSDTNYDHFMQVDPTTGVATVLQANTGQTTGLSFPLSLVKPSDTEAKFTMPASDATFNYDIVRDMEIAVNAVMPASIRIQQNQQGSGYEPVNPEEITPEVKDAIDGEGQAVTMNEVTEQTAETGDYTLKLQKLGDEETWVDADPDNLSVGTYRYEVTGANLYGGVCYTNEFKLFEGYPVTIPAGEYVTYYSDSDNLTVDENSGAKLYTITAVSGNIAIATEIPSANAGMPFLIFNSTDEPQTFMLIPTTAQINQTSAREFVGTTTATTIAASTTEQSNYAFNGKQFVYVKNSIDVAANKAWLEVGTPNSARTLTIVFDDSNATGLKAIDNGQLIMDNDDWYDLNGRKLSAAPKRKGVYIKNGKKVVVK